MNFRPSSIASSFDFKFMIEKPPMTSLVSVNGPSVIVSFPFDSRIRAVRGATKSAERNHFARLRRFLAQLADRFHQRLRRRARAVEVFVAFDDHHVTHRVSPCRLFDRWWNPHTLTSNDTGQNRHEPPIRQDRAGATRISGARP
jgi:hypothetical protein